MKKSMRAIFYCLLGISIILLDQLAKQKVISVLLTGSYTVTSWLTLRLLFNRGVAWGIFNSADTLPFVLVTTVIIFITLIIAASAYNGLLQNRSIIGELLIIAGSLSNLIDRVMHHAVIDFIQLSYKGYLWPVFNLADFCIVLGAFLLLIKQCQGI